MIIFGVDPGSVNCGYGVINENKNKVELIEYGVIHAKKKESELPQRIQLIFEKIQSKIITTKPDAFIIESVFFSKNVQSLVKLTHARAAAIIAATNNNIPVFEYSPNEIKKSVTGKGKAGKEQVQFMVKTLLDIKETPDLFDATDALAAAITHHYRKGHRNTGKTNWSQFIKDNPDRVV